MQKITANYWIALHSGDMDNTTLSMTREDFVANFASWCGQQAPGSLKLMNVGECMNAWVHSLGYNHVSPSMASDALNALQVTWEKYALLDGLQNVRQGLVV